MKSICLKIAPLLLSFPIFGQSADYADSFVDKLLNAKVNATRIGYIDGSPGNERDKMSDIDSIRRLVADYYYDQFRNSQDPDMPFFMFMSKGAGLTLGVGGGVRMRAYYDWNGAMPTSAFSPYTIQIPEDKANSRHFGTTPSGTYINFRLIGHNTAIGSYGLYVEADFTGWSGRDLKLKKAYALVGCFTLGYAASTFSDPAAQPAIVDAAGPSNKFSNTCVLVRYMSRFGKGRKWSAAVSAETPSTAVDLTGPGVGKASDWLPDAAAFLQYEWMRGQHLRLSGIVRNLTYMETATDRRRNLAGWALQISSVAHPESHITSYLTLNYGRGYAGLGGDMMRGAYDLVPDPTNPDKLYAPEMAGWCVGLQYNFLPNLFTTVSASQTLYMPQKGEEPDEYKSGLFACANIFYSVTPRITFAAEYDWGMRRNISGVHKAASRGNLTAMFSF